MIPSTAHPAPQFLPIAIIDRSIIADAAKLPVAELQDSLMTTTDIFHGRLRIRAFSALSSYDLRQRLDSVSYVDDPLPSFPCE